jgi:hypothetical protein
MEGINKVIALIERVPHLPINKACIFHHFIPHCTCRHKSEEPLNIFGFLDFVAAKGSFFTLLEQSNGRKYLYIKIIFAANFIVN